MRLIEVTVGVRVRLVLGHLVGDGHAHIRLVFPLEVLHLGRVTIMGVNLVRTEVCIAMLIVMRGSILVVIAVIVIMFSLVVSVDEGLIMVSIGSCGVVAVRVPVILVVGVMDWHVCGHVPRAENVG